MSLAEFRYFDNSKIDYWNANPATLAMAVPESAGMERSAESGSSVPTARPSPSVSAFEWKTYLDPGHDEFFKEGDYSPPKPFVAVARDPSDENLKHWFDYLKLKSDLSNRLQTRIREYVAKSGVSPNASAKLNDVALNINSGIGPNSDQSVARVDELSKHFTFRLYFDSHCPHCRNLISELMTLNKMGFFVELRQIDDEFIQSVPFPIQRATKEEIKSLGIKSVPHLLVGNLKQKTVFTIQGFHTASAILNTLRTEETK